jgi:hypothetical protein
MIPEARELAGLMQPASRKRQVTDRVTFNVSSPPELGGRDPAALAELDGGDE